MVAADSQASAREPLVNDSQHKASAAARKKSLTGAATEYKTASLRVWRVCVAAIRESLAHPPLLLSSAGSLWPRPAPPRPCRTWSAETAVRYGLGAERYEATRRQRAQHRRYPSDRNFF